MPVPAPRQITRRRSTRWAALLPLLAVGACTTGAAPPPVVDVDRGEVVASVAATGSLVSITEQNLGFAEGGELAEVLVEVGQRVEPGQILARLDDFALSRTLEQSNAQLAQQQAALDKIRNSNSVEAAAATLDQARAVLDATGGQVDATNRASDVAVDRARVQLEFDRKGLDLAEKQLREAEAACAAGGGTSTAPSVPADPATPPSTAPSAPAQAGSGGGLGGLLGGGRAEGGSAGTADGSTGATGGTTGGATEGSAGGQAAPDPACQTVPTAESAVQQAKGAVVTARTNLATAEQQANTDRAAGRVSIEQARTNVVAAENELGLASTDRPADTSSQEAMVRDAQAAVALAQRDLDAAALRAPTAGVISEVNGAAGEFLPAASGTTALAPGSSARIPEAVASGAAAGGDAAAGAGGAAGGPFIVLNDVESFQLVVPFEESDAARIQPNQEVDVSVDAVPGLTTPATVLAVAPTGRDVSGIVNYYASIVLREADPQLRDGQTAEAAVRVEAAEGVLRVPSSTVRTENGQRMVDVLGEDGEPVPAPFVPGLVGDEFTEVRSGLDEGQSVVLPQGQVAAAPGGPPQN